MNVVFFGSTSDSMLVLEKLDHVVAVVTQPPKPVGRNQVVTPTPVHRWAESRGISVTTLDAVAPFKPDLLICASYGEKIPMEIVQSAKFRGLNVHPSLLPRFRGADPVPWAILSGDHQTGVTIVTVSREFDEGNIIAQKKVAITPSDEADPLRTRLFTMGAQLLIEALPDYISGKNKGTPQKTGNEPYAKRFTRGDGFEPWEKIIDPKESERLNRKFRALHPWPGLWTMLGTKRLKILGFDSSPTTVQLEGKKPVPYEQFRTAYLADS